MNFQSCRTTSSIPRPSVTAVPSSHGLGERSASTKVFITKVGLKITADLSFDDWSHAGHQLSNMLDSSSWCLGDWLVYGMRHYGDRYQQAIQATGLRYQTLRNYFWVANQFPLERRHHHLTFQHHAEVASLPPSEQDSLLERAEQLRWTTKQLRAEVKNERADGDRAPDAAVLPRVRVSNSQLQKWYIAAEKSEIQFDKWLISALDRAAEQVISPGLEEPASDYVSLAIDYLDFASPASSSQ
jgi:hypothetical protein